MDIWVVKMYWESNPLYCYHVNWE